MDGRWIYMVSILVGPSITHQYCVGFVINGGGSMTAVTIYNKCLSITNLELIVIIIMSGFLKEVAVTCH